MRDGSEEAGESGDTGGQHDNFGRCVGFVR